MAKVDRLFASKTYQLLGRPCARGIEWTDMTLTSPPHPEAARRPAPSLLDAALVAARRLFADVVRRVAGRLLARGMQVAGDEELDARPFLLDEGELARHVAACRAHLIDGLPAGAAELLAPMWLAVVGEEMANRRGIAKECGKKFNLHELSSS